MTIFELELVNDEAFESTLIAVTRLKRQSVKPIIDLCWIVQFQDLFGSLDDFIEVEDRGAGLLDVTSFSGRDDLVYLFRKSVALWVVTVSEPDEGA